jgi:hypothetical protein
MLQVTIRKQTVLVLSSITVKLQYTNLEVFTTMWLRTPFFWDVTLHHWAISFQCFKDITFLQNVRNQLLSTAASYPGKNGVLKLQCPKARGRIHIYKFEAPVTDQHSSTSATRKFKLCSLTLLKLKWTRSKKNKKFAFHYNSMFWALSELSSHWMVQWNNRKQHLQSMTDTTQFSSNNHWSQHSNIKCYVAIVIQIPTPRINWNSNLIPCHKRNHKRGSNMGPKICRTEKNLQTSEPTDITEK